jgi:hypothetical protein
VASFRRRLYIAVGCGENSIRLRRLDAAARRLWGTPLVVSNAVAAGVSYSVAQGAVGLNVDSQGVQVTWSESSNADDWSKNLLRARCEGRYATSVYAPLGICVADLTA